MAYNSNNLSAMFYSNGTTWWTYRTSDEDAPLSPGYFDRERQFRAGDILQIIMLGSEPIEGSLAADVAHSALRYVTRVKPSIKLGIFS